jgi:probable rRNA maturation factor
MNELEIAVAMPCPAWADAVPEVEELCRRAAAGSLRMAPRALRGTLEVSLVLADDDLVRGLNRQYRGQDEPTNVLSFATLDGEDGTDDGPLLLGDVILAYQTTAMEAARDNKTTADHLTHLVVHGVLHLLGYDHLGETDAEEMEGLERAVLGSLGIADPYESDPSDSAEERDRPT